VNQGKRFFAPSIIALSIAFMSSASRAGDAEVVMMLGHGEVKESSQENWRAAAVKQKLKAGDSVRTGSASQLALVLADQTQVRLNENSVFQIGSVGNGQDGTTLSVAKGRIWAQAKQAFKGIFRSTAGMFNTAPLRVNTPTATIGIRGTDWEVVVDDGGKTTVTVFSGQVEVGNELGQLALGPNEQAVTEHGKAPVKSLLSHAADRVQWVTAYRSAPRRWLTDVPAPLEDTVKAIERGDYAGPLGILEAQRKSPAAAILLADLYLALGRSSEAIDLLAPLAADGKGSSAAVALLARARVIAGDSESARRLLTAGLQARPADAELSLALADLLRLQGEATPALALFAELARSHPDSADAWFGVGRIESEKENIAPARQALDHALRLAPEAAGYLGELATLETAAGNYAAAKSTFDAALAKAPDDYLALTGLGILQLQAGQPEAALQSFLKAGVIEPRFARAQLYTGVAYYQLGNTRRALESVRKATELDPKDPLPHMMLAMIHGDALELSAATEAAREAQARLPYLKSLNQLLNNQKGSANVGAALAAQGMDEWARAYAADSYSPHWAGSALFLADRLPDGYNKNAELYKGFLLDPLVFGASNRFSSLVPVPGHYGSVGYFGQRGSQNQDALRASANGLSATSVPIAYSIVADGARMHLDPNTYHASGHSLTLGLGARPNHDLGVFYFGTQTTSDADITGGANLPDDQQRLRIGRHDLGFSYRLSPDNQIMVKGGRGLQTTKVWGAMFDSSFPEEFAGPGSSGLFADLGTLGQYHASIRNDDFGIRQNIRIDNGLVLGFGYEYAKQDRSLDYVRSFNTSVNLGPIPIGTPLQIGQFVERKLDSSGWYLSAKKNIVENFDVALGAAYQKFKVDSELDVDQILVGFPASFTQSTSRERDSFSELNHRFGFRYSPMPGHQLRAVYQRWRRPVGSGTLGETDTLGIPVDDRLADQGGLLRRFKLQYDAQLNNAFFVQAFADRRQVNNISSVTSQLFSLFGVTELDVLRARKPVFGEPYNELERTPVFGQGEVASGGLAVNWLVNKDWSLAARYVNASSDNTASAFSGNKVPLIPRHYGNLSLFWQPYGRWLLGLSSTYRSMRYADEANATPLNAGWNHGLRTYWETDDKRWSLEAAVNNLHTDKKSALDQKAEILFTTIYRF